VERLKTLEKAREILKGAPLRDDRKKDNQGTKGPDNVQKGKETKDSPREKPE